MEAFLIHNMAPIMFGCLVLLLLLGYPVAFALAANGLVFALIGIELGLFPTNFLQALPERVYGVMNNDTLLGHPVLHLHGTDPRTIRDGRGSARHDRAALRPGARRPRLRGDLRGRPARRHHRRGRGLGDLDGADLAADHAALRLRPAGGLGRDRGLRHARPDHPAVPGPDRPGRPARPLGRRHVQRCLRAGPGADGPLCRLHPADHHRLPEGGAGPAAGSADPARTRDVDQPAGPRTGGADRRGRGLAGRWRACRAHGPHARARSVRDAADLDRADRGRAVRADEGPRGGTDRVPGHRGRDLGRGGAVRHALHRSEGRCRLCRHRDDHRRHRGLHHRLPQPAASRQAALQAGRAGRVRHGPASGADLPGAGHHLHRRRHADRGRCHGCRRRPDPWR